jgi:hypothetical protein
VVLSGLQLGQTSQIVGKNTNSSWWYIVDPQNASHDSNYDVAGPRTAMTQEGIHGDWSDCRASTAFRELIASLGSTRAKGNEKPPTISRRGLVCDFQGVDRISINSL